jgi:hypothetical protein
MWHHVTLVRTDVSEEHQFLQKPHSIKSQKTTFFNMIAVTPVLNSLSSFRIVSMAECECGDRLQTGKTFSGSVKCTRIKGQQWWMYCLKKAK